MIKIIITILAILIALGVGAFLYIKFVLPIIRRLTINMNPNVKTAICWLIIIAVLVAGGYWVKRLATPYITYWIQKAQFEGNYLPLIITSLFFFGAGIRFIYSYSYYKLQRLAVYMFNEQDEEEDEDDEDDDRPKLKLVDKVNLVIPFFGEVSLLKLYPWLMYNTHFTTTEEDDYGNYVEVELEPSLPIKISVFLVKFCMLPIHILYYLILISGIAYFYIVQGDLFTITDKSLIWIFSLIVLYWVQQIIKTIYFLSVFSGFKDWFILLKPRLMVFFHLFMPVLVTINFFALFICYFFKISFYTLPILNLITILFPILEALIISNYSRLVYNDVVAGIERAKLFDDEDY